MNNTNSPSIANPSKMFDLKMCLLDFMRISSNGTRQKKTLKEMSNRNPPQYMHNTFSKGDMIYFNENISMTSRCNTIKFSRCPTGNFKPNAVTSPRSTNPAEQQRIYEWIEPKRVANSVTTASTLNRSLSGFSLNRCDRIAPNAYEQMRRPRRAPAMFPSDGSSDERGASTTTTATGKSHSESPLSESSVRETETDDYLCSYSDCEQTVADATSMANLDSFCTLCTSSFSYNRCQHCENSSCGSKCDSAQGDRASAQLLLTNGGGGSVGVVGRSAVGGEGDESSETSGAISSDCESVLYR